MQPEIRNTIVVDASLKIIDVLIQSLIRSLKAHTCHKLNPIQDMLYLYNTQNIHEYVINWSCLHHPSFSSISSTPIIQIFTSILFWNYTFVVGWSLWINYMSTNFITMIFQCEMTVHCYICFSTQSPVNQQHTSLIPTDTWWHLSKVDHHRKPVNHVFFVEPIGYVLRVFTIKR